MIETIEAFLNIVPVQFIALLILCMGATHILKIAGGNALPVLHAKKETWVSYSLACAMLSGFGLGYLAASRAYIIFFGFDPDLMGMAYAILCPFAGSLLIHSDSKYLRGMKTHIDRKFAEKA
jgi:hypothetical protein